MITERGVDTGFVVVDVNYQYYTGKGWSDELSRAKIYVKSGCAKNMANKVKDRVVDVVPVEIRVKWGYRSV